jgi:TolA-binding protein
MSAAERGDAELDALLEAAAADLAADARPDTGDDALIARVIEGAITRTNAAGAQDPRRRRRSTVSAGLLVAAVLVATSGAFALMHRARTVRRAPNPSPSAEATPTGLRVRSPAAEEVASPTEASSLQGLQGQGASSAHGSPASPPELTAQELFAQANETRRHGEATAAVRQYMALQRRFPRSPEASLSLVALGRLYLDRMGEPARALAQFDEYLAGRGDGELSEEALVGRAIALQQLGRTAEERRAWRSLLAAFPNSLSADRARGRLGELH